MRLGRCGGGAATCGVWADPDLLNTHGLRVGDNAASARDVRGALARGRPVIVDYSTLPWSLEDGRSTPPAERGWSDLARRSEERRVGKECVSTCRSRWSPDH